MLGRSDRRAEPAIAPFLDAWAALCTGAGTRSLTSAAALRDGTAEQREALAVALVALGWPEGMASARALGQVLGGIQLRPDPLGRRLESSRAKGGRIWYVVTRSAEAVAGMGLRLAGDGR